MKQGTQNNQASGTPAPALNSADPLAAAQANADEIAQQFVNSATATYDERAALVQDLRIAVAQVDAIERAQR